MTLSENQPPRVALRPTLAKKTSRIGLRDAKTVPKPTVKPATKSLSFGNTPPKATIRGARTVRGISPIETVARPPSKPTPVTPLPLNRSIRTQKGFVSVRAYEEFEEERALAKAAEAIMKEESSDHSCHSHPVLQIGGLSKATIHMFKVAKSKAKIHPTTPPIPPRNPRREQVSTDSTDADDEESDPGNLSDTVRSALAKSGAGSVSLHRAQTPASVKSVRWAPDPAVVAYGRFTSGTKLDFPPASTPSRNPNPKATDFTEALRTLSKLKKEDQKALARLLQRMDTSPTIDEGPVITQNPRREETKERTGLDGMFAKKLNPQAPVFRDLSSLKKKADQQMQDRNLKEAAIEEAQKTADQAKRELDHYKKLMADFVAGQQPVVTSTPGNGPKTETPKIGKVDRNQKEPTWVNIFNPPLPEDMPKGYCSSTYNPFNSKPPGFTPTRPPFLPHITPIGFPSAGSTQGFPDLSQTVWVPLQMLQTSLGFQAGISALPQPDLWANPLGLLNPFTVNNKFPPPGQKDSRRPPHKTKAGRGPLVDVSSQIIPPDFGPCRVAQPVDQVWGQSLLDKFTAKYPQTGKVDTKAKKKVPGQMRQAAAIQHSLELLIYQEKEKQAMDEKLGIVKSKAEKEDEAEKPEEPLVVKSTEEDPFSCAPVPDVKGCSSVPVPVLTMPTPVEKQPTESWEQWWLRV